MVVEFDDDISTRLEATPAPTYTYQALPSKGDHIRLIKIGPGEFNDRIEVEIKTVEFDRFDTPPYFALSYTWNDPHHDRLIIEGKHIPMDDPLRLEYDFRHPVWFGDQRLLISTNLRDALRRLRHATQPQTFWIDALCINQEDLNERASQVLIMQRIYHKAKMVKMWLSEAGEGYEDGLNLIRRLVEISSELVGNSTSDLYREDYLESLQLPPFPSSAWKAVMDLLDRPVFHRIWIVQEVVSAVATLMYCGPYEPISFDMLASAVNLLEKTGWLLAARKKFKPDEAYFLSITAINYIRTMWLKEQTMELRHSKRRVLVSVTRRFLASDPSDKVFALISLINDYGHRSLHGEDCPDGMIRDRHKSRILPGIQRVIDGHQDLVAASILQTTTDPALVTIGNTLVAYMDVALKILPIFQSPNPEVNTKKELHDLEPTWKEVNDGIGHFRRHVRTLEEDCHLVQQFLERLQMPLFSRISSFYSLLGMVNATTLMSLVDDDEYLEDIQKLEDLVKSIRRSLTDPSAIPENLQRDFGVVGPMVSSNDLYNNEWDSDSSVGGTVQGQRVEGSGIMSTFTVPMDDQGNVDLEQLNQQLERFTVRNDDEGEHRDWAWTPKGLRTPDYRLAIEDIYTEFTVKCMRDDRSLEMLLGMEDRSERVHIALPSWVPDFAVSPSSPSLKRWNNVAEKNVYCASGTEPAHVNWDPVTPRVLVINGYEFDTIESLAGKETIDRTLQENRPVWEALISNLPEFYPYVGRAPDDEEDDSVPLREAFWRTMIGDGVHTSTGFVTPAPEEYGRYYEILNVMLDYSTKIPDLDARMRYRVTNGLVTIDDLRQCANIEPMVMPLVGEVALPRRLCVTYDGFLGLMPAAAQEGDIIYILKGSAVPFVLRPVPDDESMFEIIGECFVYGIMNGEALWESNFEWSEITVA